VPPCDSAWGADQGPADVPVVLAQGRQPAGRPDWVEGRVKGMSYEATISRDEDGNLRPRDASRADVSSPVPAILSRQWGGERRIYASFGGPGEPCGARTGNRDEVIPERCGEIVPQARKSGCCERHKLRIWDERNPRLRPAQVPLAFDPQPMPVRGIADLPTDTHGRLKRSCALILGRLQAGPATGLELIRAGGGVRYGARVEELRKRGHVIVAEPVEEGRGIWSYRLEGA